MGQESSSLPSAGLSLPHWTLPRSASLCIWHPGLCFLGFALLGGAASQCSGCEELASDQCPAHTNTVWSLPSTGAYVPPAASLLFCGHPWPMVLFSA